MVFIIREDMKLQIKEFGRLTGVSVRTLHYYDEIGLLKPSYVDEQNGYRFYDETSLERMQEILFYRELDFPLKSIAEILASPNYDKQKAIAGHCTDSVWNSSGSCFLQSCIYAEE